MPTIPLPEPRPSSLVAETSAGETTHSPKAIPSSQQSDGGAVHVRASSPPTLPSTISPSSQAVIADSQPSSISAPAGTLHPSLLFFYSTIQSTLKSSFSVAPPYTIQRFAELILNPTAHYRTLPSYLRALDRVISVSSTADTFPLPASNPDSDSNSFLASSSPSNQANDFNGAALTQIPWLRDTASMIVGSERPLASDLRTESTSLIDGPNGAGSMETVTVSVNGMSNASRGTNAFRVNPSASTMEPSDQFLVAERAKESGLVPRQEAEADEERVHARGPEEIGMEDMGPQVSATVAHEFDAEAAVGRPGEGERVPTAEKKRDEEESKDADGDTIVNDRSVEGRVESEKEEEHRETNKMG